MNDVEAFLEVVKHGSSESKMVEAYMRAKSDLESKQFNLLKCIRSKKTSSGLVAVFPSGSEDIVTEVEDAEKALADIRADIKAYLTLTEGQPSISSLTDRLFRARRPYERPIRLPWKKSKDYPKCKPQWTSEIKHNASSGLLSKTLKAGFQR